MRGPPVCLRELTAEEAAAVERLARSRTAAARRVERARISKLAGPRLAKLGATAEVTHGGLPYDVPQAWSAAFQAHAVAADGIHLHRAA